MTLKDFYAGDTYKIPMTFKTLAGEVVPIIGSTVYFTLKRNISDDYVDAAIKKEITVHINAALGLTEVTLLPSETAVLNGIYYWGLKIELNVDNILTIGTGTLKVKQGVVDV